MKTFNPIFAVVVLVWGCGAPEEVQVQADEKPLLVETAEVRKVEIPLVATAVGSTEPYARATPGTRLMGSITMAAFKEGDLVDQGQDMVRIEDRDLRAKRAQAASGLAEAKAVLVNVERTLRRMENLFAEAAVTQQRLDEAETGYAQAVAAVSAAEQAVREVEVNLDYGTVKAPLSGVVVRKFVQVGDMAVPGVPLFTVEAQDSIKVVVLVSERDQALVGVGTEVGVEIEALQPEIQGAIEARVEALVPAADAGSRSFQMKVVLPNKTGQIKSGMFARVHFAKGSRPGLLIPGEALVRRGQLKGVYIVDQGRARLRWVRLGKVWERGIEVLSGLNGGEEVITTGAHRVQDGQLVEVRNDG